MTTSSPTTTTIPTANRGAPRNGAGAWARRVVLGREGTARWERPALLGLLAVAALLYFWDLSASGWANSFYSAAVQAGASNWEAFFYGSSDAANSITVDKPPASLWLMALSVRAFGLSSFSILLPEALMGVATVGVIYAAVRRAFSARTALLAGGVLAITPVAALMFRFNNPDALLVLLLSLATYFTIRGIESGRVRWVLWAGVMIGLGFLTKQLQAFVILPALAGVYLVAAPGTVWRRIRHSLLALLAVVVSAGWWVAIVELVPASMRPYIGGSQTNSFLELTFGYNGLGRITGNETGSVTGGAGGNTSGGQWGATGILRLFTGEIGGQITWLLPAALILMVVAFIVMRGARGDLRRATLMLFGGWLVITGLAFSFMAGIFHAYYTVALAPALAAVVAIGASELWSQRAQYWARIIGAVTVLGTVLWAYSLLSEASTWLPWLKWVVVVLGVVAAALILVPVDRRSFRVATIATALTASLLAPLAYTIQTVTTAHTGSIVTAGPTVAGNGFGGGAGGPGGRGGFGGGQGGPGGTPPTGMTGGTGTSTGGTGTGAATGGAGGTGTATGGTGTTFTRGAGGGMAGLFGGGTVSTALSTLLKTNALQYTWVAAAIGSDSAASYQLATQEAVMPIGGFNGSDPSPTLAQFKAYVAAGKIHYFIGGSVGASNGGSNVSSQIASWVAANFTATTVGGVTVYDLSGS
ncbi:glycosyltransferase family 39 protein [Galbitalea soli]|uniref:Glycosyltransferase family 39 protein n=1 Tax=Galbitalea soli TaxID=1268042 RepID=A0A7C9PP65_9MICO|nr:glycosyltransferase family 39 protein [Galbitalea soli]NEM92125.1 glycosyltransferase family 39 protein [Galbitalea soli]NYJ31923.1 4-amino-4-deoxy-L-arabinose transferase-like glycosyltransferase [Galbitalea soli]